MALQTNNLYVTTSRAALARLMPAQGPGAVVTATFAAGTALLTIGTPVFIDNATGFKAKIVPGSATAQEKEIFGFVINSDVQLLSGGQVLGVIMIRGAATYADILAIQTAGNLAGTEANLALICRDPVVRQRGLHIEGLDFLGSTAALNIN